MLPGTTLYVVFRSGRRESVRPSRHHFRTATIKAMMETAREIKLIVTDMESSHLLANSLVLSPGVKSLFRFNPSCSSTTTSSSSPTHLHRSGERILKKRSLPRTDIRKTSVGGKRGRRRRDPDEKEAGREENARTPALTVQ